MPWPFGPTGTPACWATHEVKYAHHGPTPDPAVAVRYSPMRGASFEPGGCSATPSSAVASAAIRCPVLAFPERPADDREAACCVPATGVIADPSRVAKSPVAAVVASGVAACRGAVISRTRAT